MQGMISLYGTGPSRSCVFQYASFSTQFVQVTICCIVRVGLLSVLHVERTAKLDTYQCSVCYTKKKMHVILSAWRHEYVFTQMNMYSVFWAARGGMWGDTLHVDMSAMPSFIDSSPKESLHESLEDDPPSIEGGALKGTMHIRLPGGAAPRAGPADSAERIYRYKASHI